MGSLHQIKRDQRRGGAGKSPARTREENDVTISEALDMIDRGETPEEYKKRTARLRRLVNEREFLEDALTILTEPEDAARREKKERRLAVVIEAIKNLS